MPKCKHAAHSQGLCSGCLKAQDRAIEAGETALAKLIDAGYRLPKKKQGRKGARAALAVAELSK